MSDGLPSAPDPTGNSKGSPPKPAWGIAIGVSAAVAVVVGATLLSPDVASRVSQQTVNLVIVGLSPWLVLLLFPFVKSIGKDGIVMREVEAVQQRMDALEGAVSLPGRPQPGPEPQLPASRVQVDRPKEGWDDDPNKTRFGGSPAANGRILEARLRPKAGPRSRACLVELEVRSTEPQRPLDGTVTVHLHPTFGRHTTYPLSVKKGRARDSFVSYGAFTIGVEADGGKTRLELDLMDVPGGTSAFYES